MLCAVHCRPHRAVSKHLMPQTDARSVPAAGGDLASSQHLSPVAFHPIHCCASGGIRRDRIWRLTSKPLHIRYFFAQHCISDLLPAPITCPASALPTSATSGGRYRKPQLGTFDPTPVGYRRGRLSEPASSAGKG